MRVNLNAALALAALAVILVFALFRPGDETVSGHVSVVDGDSLRLNGVSLRLKGIDAPELHQTCERTGGTYPCGVEARAALEALLGSRSISCVIEGLDRYRRSLARCEAGGQDLGGTMVSQGMAVGYGGYEREENRARRASRGLWAGSFQRPSEWRRQNGARRGDA